MKPRTTHPEEATRTPHLPTGEPPPTSECPAAPAPRESPELIHHPAVDFGGLDAMPNDLLGETQQCQEELNYTGLDVELPGEDQARGTGAPRHPPTERWEPPL